MTSSIETISLLNLSFAFIPVFITLIILYKWSLNTKNAIYALIRMLVQLLLIGYFLSSIFQSDSAFLILILLLIMLLISSMIALNSISEKKFIIFKWVFFSILIGGGFTLILITQAVLNLKPWHQAQAMIPLAGMIFANTMNSISLAIERLLSELSHKVSYESARKTAFQAAMIPIINSLFAVGLVSLPGMMTGQILSGVSPLIAVRYQIMVMCMIFGSAGISTAIFLTVFKSILATAKNKKC